MKDYSKVYLDSVIQLGADYGIQFRKSKSAEKVELSSYHDEMIIEIQFIGEVTGSFLLAGQEATLRTVAESILNDDDQKLFESFWLDFLNIAIQPSLERLSKEYRYLTITAPRIYHAPVSFPSFPHETEKLNWEGQEIHLHTLLDHRTLDTMQAYLQAKEANESKSRFLANMSHDIRTPLNAVLGFSQLLEEKDLDEESHIYVKRIRKSSISLLELINDILDLSKVEAGKLSLQYKSVSIRRLFDELEQVFSLKAESKGLDIKIDVDEKVPQFVNIDGSRLRQVLVNFLSNAFKFTEQGGVVLSASWTASEEDKKSGQLQIKVFDTGIGIPEDQQEVIFSAFEQVSGQDHDKYGGTGLGLAICLRIIQMMKGRIELQSCPGEGSVFTVDLPEIMIAEPDKEQKSLSRTNLRVDFKPAKILLVDDMEINRKLLRAFLDKYPLEICEASNGKEALEKIDSFKPELVFLDMRMPVMDGYEVLAELDKDRKYDSLPIVAVTASALREDERQLEKKCAGFLSKPLRKTDLLDELKKFLSHEEYEIKDHYSATVNDKRTKTKLSLDCKKELRPLIESLKENPSNVNAMIALGNSLKKLSDKYPVKNFIDWKEKMTEACDTYDITGVSELVKSYDKLLNSLDS